jgi:nicotinamidase-related amidase
MTNPAKLDLITPDNCVLALIDYQPQMLFGVQSQDRQNLVNNLVGLARSAREFGVPTILTAVESKGFSGTTTPQLLDVFPESPVIERSTMNAWEAPAFVAAVERTGRKKLILSGLWTEVCLVLPVVDSLRSDYDTYFVTDTSGGTSKEAHDMAVSRMIQAGAAPLTWIQLVLEWQRDWGRKKHYDAVLNIMRDHAGAYGQGIEYAYTMVHGAPPARRRG